MQFSLKGALTYLYSALKFQSIAHCVGGLPLSETSREAPHEELQSVALKPGRGGLKEQSDIL